MKFESGTHLAAYYWNNPKLTDLLAEDSPGLVDFPSFPSLTHLRLRNLPNAVRLSRLPDTLIFLDIDNCPNIVLPELLPGFLTYFRLRDWPGTVLPRLHAGLTSIVFEDCDGLTAEQLADGRIVVSRRPSRPRIGNLAHLLITIGG